MIWLGMVLPTLLWVGAIVIKATVTGRRGLWLATVLLIGVAVIALWLPARVLIPGLFPGQ